MIEGMILVGYLTGEYWNGYPVFLSLEKLKDYDIDTEDMEPVYKVAKN
jgi:hypothetical protein